MIPKSFSVICQHTWSTLRCSAHMNALSKIGNRILYSTDKLIPTEINQVNRLCAAIGPSKSRDKNETEAVTHPAISMAWNEMVATQTHHSLDANEFNKNVAIANWDYLRANKITRESVNDNAYVLRFSTDELKTKLSLLNEMQPNDINDFIPLMQLTLKRLQKVRKSFDTDGLELNGSHRIYYFSQQFEVEPYLVSQRCAKFSFMLIVPLELLQLKLAILDKYKMCRKRIFNDLTCLKLSETIIKKRLKRAMSSGVKNVMPWMVKCKEDTFERTLDIHEIRNDALGKNKNIVEFFENTIGLERENLYLLSKNNPRLLQLNEKKAKDIICFILNETHFTKQSLAQNPWIFLHSLKKIKNRVAELNANGYLYDSIHILTYSSKAYQAYLDEQKLIKENMTPKIIESSKAAVCNALQLLVPGCSETEAMRLCNNVEKILDIPLDQLKTNLRTLVKSDIGKDAILGNSLLLLERAGVIQAKLDLLKVMNPKNIEEFLPLTVLSTSQLSKLSRNKNGQQLIYYLSRFLNVEPYLVAKYLAAYPPAFNYHRTTIDKCLPVLINHGFDEIDILNNIRIISIFPKTFEKRLERLLRIRNYIGRLKCWSLLCSDNKFESFIYGIEREKKQLEKIQDSLTDFLTDVAGLRRRTVLRFRRRHPHLLPNKIHDLNESVYHLYKFSYKSRDLDRRPSVLLQSISILKNRLDQLEKLNNKPDSLAVLSYTEKRFQEYINNLEQKV